MKYTAVCFLPFICVPILIAIYQHVSVKNSEETAEVTGTRFGFSSSDVKEKSSSSSTSHYININSAVGADLAQLLINNQTQVKPGDSNYNNTLLGDINYWKNGVGDQAVHFRNQCSDGSGYPKRVYVVRHTEQINKALPSWGEIAFAKNGSYQRLDLNMPVALPRRKNHPIDIMKDPPLTMSGHIQAWLIGHCLKHMGVNISHVYSSPALVCTESANTMMLGLSIEPLINVEPGLLGWSTMTQNTTYMTTKELQRFKIYANNTYKPIIHTKKMDFEESQLGEYERVYKVAKSLLKRHADIDGDILIIAHASTTETFTRMLTGGRPLSIDQYRSRVREQPYVLMSVIEAHCDKKTKWQKVVPPVQPITWHAWYPSKLWNTSFFFKRALT